MANPLKMLMGNNPMMNPQQMVMNMLKSRNPQAYSQITQMMNMGMNPRQAMSQFGITDEQIEIAKQEAKNLFGNNIK